MSLAASDIPTLAYASSLTWRPWSNGLRFTFWASFIVMAMEIALLGKVASHLIDSDQIVTWTPYRTIWISAVQWLLIGVGLGTFVSHLAALGGRMPRAWIVAAMLFAAILFAGRRAYVVEQDVSRRWSTLSCAM